MANKARTAFLPLVISIVILFFAAQFLIRGGNSHSDPKLTTPVSEKSTAEIVRSGGSQINKPRIRETSVAETEMARGFKRPIWTKLDAEREKYEANFVRDRNVSNTRGIWRNSKQVRFWIDLQASDDPELSAQAILILEGATWEKAGVLQDLNGSEKDRYTPEEWESHQIFCTLLHARALMSGTRNSLPTQEAISGGDTDDSIVLKDAQSILKTFVPRLKDPDPSRAAAAKSVIHFFTYDLFRDEPLEWWEACLHDEAESGVGNPHSGTK